ncbi:MAG: leucyl/phenylalanyl-tRNA--protein transferase [Rhodobacteraceae bacterium]|nr:leucyl/phenylalanyl-tRNA--protein transferase [Paracoccaceae bacterium]
MKDPPTELNPRLLLQAYAAGIFPMAASADSDDICWFDPQHRGIILLDRFRMSRSLAKRVRRADYQVAVNRDFAGVVAACADRPETWINAEISDFYRQMHAIGHAHSQEIYAKGCLIGGVYGVTLGGAFFGESMFSRTRDGSKIALAYLVHRLVAGGFTLFDTQFGTPHLASLGGVEVSRAKYRRMLTDALQQQAGFAAVDTPGADDLVRFYRGQRQEHERIRFKAGTHLSLIGKPQSQVLTAPAACSAEPRRRSADVQGH